MEVMTSSPIQDFNFDSACTSPYNMSAATSPRRFGNFYSAPTSPGRFSVSGRSLEELEISHVPFSWEEKPGTPKCQFVTASTINSTSASATTSVYGDAEQDLEEVDFAFDFSGHLDSGSLPADELFDQGKIKPLKPPPKFMYDQNKPVESPKTPKKLIIDAFSPRKKDGFDPFAAAIKETQKESKEEKIRGRERNVSSSSSRNNKTARSLSPFRVSNLLFDTNSSNSFSGWYKKWKLKDLLLFRSASEGRATDNDQMKKYDMLKKSQQDSYSSFRSTDSGEMSKRRSKAAPISAHELHYKINRAVSEEMKKRTSLPYRHGLLGCLGFHPTVPEMSNKGFGSGGSSMSRG